MEELKTTQLFDLTESIAADFVATAEYPWQLLPDIGAYVAKLGESLDPEHFDRVSQCVWIAKSATVATSAAINGPCIIDEGAEIRHGAFIRGNVLVGKRAVVGNSTELKNCILFNGVQVPHYNYVGDSILGYKAHMGAGAIASNVKNNGSKVTVRARGEAIATGLKKFGIILGDRAEIGCNSVLNPGTVVGRDAIIYPLSSVRGFVPADSIYKSEGNIVTRESAN